MGAAAGLPADPAAAVEVLVREHGDRLYGIAGRLCGRPEEAEDLVQEVFLQAFRGWRAFEGRSKPLTWLYTIASRACRLPALASFPIWRMSLTPQMPFNPLSLFRTDSTASRPRPVFLPR